MLTLRSISRKKNKLVLLAVWSGTILAACTMTRTTGQDKYIPCGSDAIIRFSAPDPDGPLKETEANAFDTPGTISQIRVHNAKYRELCK